MSLRRGRFLAVPLEEAAMSVRQAAAELPVLIGLSVVVALFFLL
jgi:hypothetical protein